MVLARHQNGVDDLDHAVGLDDIGGGDVGRATLFVGDLDLAHVHGEGERAAFNGLGGVSSVALLDPLLQVLGRDRAGDDVVREDLGESGLILTSVSTVPAGSLAKASSVGAKTVNGPAPSSVSTRPAAFTAATRVLWMGELTAFSTMFLVGYIAAPPTVGSAFWATAETDVRAIAAPAIRVSRDFFIGVFLSISF
jgi:hypothetical protein